MEQIAIYLRLSKEDEFVKDESNSITNQRAFIRGFINKNKELRKMSVMEFVDDGYSGKNMDRPDMQRMLELVKRKQISCVIVKDFSRFSRDHIEQGKYIEQIFPFMGVRFIAINDNYDSADYVGGIGEIDVAFKGILYDFFSEEQSSKVSLTLDAKRGNGKYIAILQLSVGIVNIIVSGNTPCARISFRSNTLNGPMTTNLVHDNRVPF